MNYTGVLYFPIMVSLLEGVALELIEARFGLKGVAAFIKLLCKIYKEEGYYLLWDKEQCTLFVHKLGNELSDVEMQEIVDLLIGKGLFDRKMYEEHHALTSEYIQKVWLDATKRRKRDLDSLPYFLVKAQLNQKEGESNKAPYRTNDTPSLPFSPKNDIHHVAFSPENAYRSEQSKEKESKETPPLTPQGENGGRMSRNSSLEIPGYAHNKKTHNLEGLMLGLNQLNIVDCGEINAILRLSDYGRLGGYVFKVISSTRWSTILAKGKYIIAALRKERCGNS